MLLLREGRVSRLCTNLCICHKQLTCSDLDKKYSPVFSIPPVMYLRKIYVNVKISICYHNSVLERDLILCVIQNCPELTLFAINVQSDQLSANTLLVQIAVWKSFVIFSQIRRS